MADKKITMTSLTEVELNAPTIQLNGENVVELNSILVDLNADDEITQHAGNNITVNAGGTLDMDATKITLN